MTLDGVRVLDLSRQAPGPFCSMMLADQGAEVLMLEAPPGVRGSATRVPERGEEWRRGYQALRRNKRSMVLNLKDPEGLALFYRLCEDADVILEGFRPGVVERLGVDYGTVAAINPRLVYCSLSGYGQTGPNRDLVGHDINYIAMGGALGVIGRPGQPPSIPQNLVADFAGGGMMAAFAIVSALLARERTGRGQYLDVAMSDGVLYLMASAAAAYFGGGAPPRAGETTLSGAVPYYDVYECADGRWLSVGAIEPHFWERLCEVLGCEEYRPFQRDTSRHPEIRARFERIFKARTRDEWFEALRDVEACVAPVLSLEEALHDPHHEARRMVVNVVDHRHGTFKHVGVAPRFSETPGGIHSIAPLPGQDTNHTMALLGYGIEEIRAFKERGVIG